ncbi:MAG TPA: hypothetical protein VI932_02615 [Bacteroidota bacterium]|nr:hypothetical protein [Bacteroidota bacterium]
MTLNLTPDEYRSLLKVVFLGNWLANAYREEPLPEFDNIEQVIMSRASSFGADDLVGHDPKKKTWVPSREFEEAMQDLVDEYNVEALYDELGYWLARRDLIIEIGDEKAEGMTPAGLSSAQQSYLDKYDLEFDIHGIERIGIIENLPVKGSR